MTKPPPIIIDAEFRSLIPPLADDVRAALEESIVRDGCRDPLVVWKEERILLDGHNRYEICERLKLDFETYVVSLPDREAAADWIDANQLGRRNLSPEQASHLRGRRYNRTKTAGHGAKSECQNGTQNTAEKLAEQHGVSPRTIMRDAAFATAVEIVKAIDPDIEKKIGRNEAPKRGAIIKAAKAVDDKEKAQAILSGEYVPDEKPEREQRGPKRSEQQTLNDCIDEIEDAIHRATKAYPKLSKAIGAQMQAIVDRIRK